MGSGQLQRSEKSSTGGALLETLQTLGATIQAAYKLGPAAVGCMSLVAAGVVTVALAWTPLMQR